MLLAAEAEREPREAVAADREAVENARELVAQEDVGELGHHAHLEALAALWAVVVVEAERELRKVVAGPTGTCTALFRCTGTCNASAGTCTSRCARYMYQSFCAIHLPKVFCVRYMYQSLVSPVHVTRVRRYVYQWVGLCQYMCQWVGGAPLKVLLLTRTRLAQAILHDGCPVLQYMLYLVLLQNTLLYSTILAALCNKKTWPRTALAQRVALAFCLVQVWRWYTEATGESCAYDLESRLSVQ